jgi:hypothetical protein
VDQQKFRSGLPRLTSDGGSAMDEQFVRGSEDSDDISCVFGLGHDGMEDPASAVCSLNPSICHVSTLS